MFKTTVHNASYCFTERSQVLVKAECIILLSKPILHVFDILITLRGFTLLQKKIKKIRKKPKKLDRDSIVYFHIQDYIVFLMKKNFFFI